MSASEIAAEGERFRVYFEHSSDAVLVCRRMPDGSFVYQTINRGAERLFGLTPEQVIGRTPFEVFAPETARAKERGYRLAIAQPNEPITLQRTLDFPSGSLRLETVITAVPDPLDPNSLHVISGSRDLAVRAQLEARMQQSQCLEIIAQLTGGVAHDFNNLLTVVTGNLALLRRRIGDDDPRTQRYLASIDTAAQRGAKLTASLLAFSRRQTLHVEPLDIGRHVAQSQSFLQQALGREVALVVRPSSGVLSAKADAAQFDAALLNLVVNARDAVSEPGAAAFAEVSIAVQRALLSEDDLIGNDEARPGEFIAVSVEDTGVGMSATVRARAFEPFFTTKEVGRGTGLGLSQVFGFVRQLGGHVTLDSAPGQGTTVVMYLPAAALEEEAAALAPVAPTGAAARATILVVDDDRNILDVTAEVLRDAGFEVLTAPSAPAGLAILSGPQPIDLLFSDVVMPGGATGYDLAVSASQLRPGLPILLSSGYPGAGRKRIGGVERFPILPKPFTRDALLAQVTALLVPPPSR